MIESSSESRPSRSGERSRRSSSGKPKGRTRNDAEPAGQRGMRGSMESIASSGSRPSGRISFPGVPVDPDDLGEFAGYARPGSGSPESPDNEIGGTGGGPKHHKLPRPSVGRGSTRFSTASGAGLPPRNSTPTGPFCDRKSRKSIEGNTPQGYSRDRLSAALDSGVLGSSAKTPTGDFCVRPKSRKSIESADSHEIVGKTKPTGNFCVRPKVHRAGGNTDRDQRLAALKARSNVKGSEWSQNNYADEVKGKKKHSYAYGEEEEEYSYAFGVTAPSQSSRTSVGAYARGRESMRRSSVGSALSGRGSYLSIPSDTGAPPARRKTRDGSSNRESALRQDSPGGSRGVQATGAFCVRPNSNRVKHGPLQHSLPSDSGPPPPRRAGAASLVGKQPTGAFCVRPNSKSKMQASPGGASASEASASRRSSPSGPFCVRPNSRSKMAASPGAASSGAKQPTGAFCVRPNSKRDLSAKHGSPGGASSSEASGSRRSSPSGPFCVRPKSRRRSSGSERYGGAEQDSSRGSPGTKYNTDAAARNALSTASATDTVFFAAAANHYEIVQKQMAAEDDDMYDQGTGHAGRHGMARPARDTSASQSASPPRSGHASSSSSPGPARRSTGKVGSGNQSYAMGQEVGDAMPYNAGREYERLSVPGAEPKRHSLLKPRGDQSEKLKSRKLGRLSLFDDAAADEVSNRGWSQSSSRGSSRSSLDGLGASPRESSVSSAKLARRRTGSRGSGSGTATTSPDPDHSSSSSNRSGSGNQSYAGRRASTGSVERPPRHSASHQNHRPRHSVPDSSSSSSRSALHVAAVAQSRQSAELPPPHPGVGPSHRSASPSHGLPSPPGRSGGSRSRVDRSSPRGTRGILDLSGDGGIAESGILGHIVVPQSSSRRSSSRQSSRTSHHNVAMAIPSDGSQEREEQREEIAKDGDGSASSDVSSDVYSDVFHNFSQLQPCCHRTVIRSNKLII